MTLVLLNVSDSVKTVHLELDDFEANQSEGYSTLFQSNDRWQELKDVSSTLDLPGRSATTLVYTR